MLTGRGCLASQALRLTRIEYNATRASPKTASLTPRIPKVLHLQVKTSVKHSPDELTAAALPTEWTLCLSGQLHDRVASAALPPAQKEHAKLLCRLSDVVQRVVVNLSRDHEPPGQNIVEWTRPLTHAGMDPACSQDFGDFDGLMVTRKVRDVRPFNVEILIDLRFEPARHKLSVPLRKLLGIHTESRQRVIKALYEYCRAKQLFDPATGRIMATPEIAAIFIPEGPEKAGPGKAEAGQGEAAKPAVKSEPADGSVGDKAKEGSAAADGTAAAEGKQDSAEPAVKKEGGEAVKKVGGEEAAPPKAAANGSAAAGGEASAAEAGTAALAAAAAAEAGAAGATQDAAPALPLLTIEQISAGLDMHLSAPDPLRIRQRVEVLPNPAAAAAVPGQGYTDAHGTNVKVYQLELDLDDRIVEYLEPPQFVAEVQRMEATLDGIMGRIRMSQRQHDFFRQLSGSSETFLQQLFMRTLGERLDQHQRAAGWPGEQRVDLFQKRRAQIYNTGWVESCLPTLLRTETEASPWAAAAEAAQKTRVPGAGRRSSRVSASPQFPNASGGGYG